MTIEKCSRFICFPMLLMLSGIAMHSQDGIEFYPHSVGNVWVYAQAGTETRRRFEILRDSSSTNDSLLFLFYTTNSTSCFILDKVNKYVLHGKPDTNYKRTMHYPLEASLDTVFLRRPGQDQQVSRMQDIPGKVLGRNTILRAFSVTTKGIPIDDNAGNYYLAKGIGYCLLQAKVSGEIGEYLLGCIVDGDTLGDVRLTTTDVTHQVECSESPMVFPNPCGAFIFVNTGSQAGKNIDLYLFNTVGVVKQISYERQTADLFSIETRSLPTGVYQLIVNIDGKLSTLTFVKD